MPYSEDFEIFWKSYPRKVGKTAAWKSWQKMRPALDAVLRALAWQIKTRQWLDSGGIFIPHPSTYINQGRWEDEPMKSDMAAPVSPAMGLPPAKSGRAMVL